MSKHLTDAECAAEFWKATLSRPVLRAGVLDHSEAGRRAVTWHRFATLPHAHDEG